MNNKLSICVPTYNRAAYLPIALDSILDQISDRVEIAICDNGSIDETPSVIASYVRKYPWIKHYRFEKNVGPDRCFLKSVEIAGGEYCWFLGDDDAIDKGSIHEVLQSLDQNRELSGISINRKIFDATLKNEQKYEPIYPGLLSSRHYRDSHQCIKELFTYFGYMSGQIFRRSLWMQAIRQTPNVERYFNAYSILFLVVKSILIDPNWLYLHTAYVQYRSGNDSFEKELGIYKRFLLDAIGYESLARGLFRRWDPLYRQCLDQVCSQHLQARIVYMKRSGVVPFFPMKALAVLLPRYWMLTSFWKKNLPILLIPNFIRPSLRFLYRLVRPR
ncbi:MAG TPA: glycosyltransferase family 2 protein [Chlamydiales bacterium]|nr:glycosyltransferase family 2 protein [Chlamydiales bacterium]